MMKFDNTLEVYFLEFLMRLKELRHKRMFWGCQLGQSRKSTGLPHIRFRPHGALHHESVDDIVGYIIPPRFWSDITRISSLLFAVAIQESSEVHLKFPTVWRWVIFVLIFETLQYILGAKKCIVWTLMSFLNRICWRQAWSSCYSL